MNKHASKRNNQKKLMFNLKVLYYFFKSNKETEQLKNKLLQNFMPKKENKILLYIQFHEFKNFGEKLRSNEKSIKKKKF